MKKRNVTILLLIAISFLFFIPACSEKTENKDSKVKKNPKIEETITNDAVAVAPETQNPITEAAVESQPASGETENSPTTEAFIPDPPVTAADTSVQFVVGAPVVDKQVFDTTDSKVIEALNAYYSVLTGQTNFCFFWGAEEPSQNTSVKNIRQLEDFISPRKLRRFAVIDLDNDSIPEVALSNGEYEDDFFIFKYHNDYIYVYNRGIRSFNVLKIDGTFHWASSAFETGTATLSFQGNTTEAIDKVYDLLKIDNTREAYINGKRVTEEEYWEAYEYQKNKPNAVWYEFTEEYIEKYYTMCSAHSMAFAHILRMARYNSSLRGYYTMQAR